jgi:hypothetical protein
MKRRCGSGHPMLPTWSTLDRCNLTQSWTTHTTCRNDVHCHSALMLFKTSFGDTRRGGMGGPPGVAEHKGRNTCARRSQRHPIDRRVETHALPTKGSSRILAGVDGTIGPSGADVRPRFVRPGGGGREHASTQLAPTIRRVRYACSASPVASVPLAPARMKGLLDRMPIRANSP